MEFYPKISIITPSFNQGKFIEQTILSVINQNYPNFEYIIIDGGSSDNTIEVIKKYESFLTYWVSEKDKGQTETINIGIKIATADIITWLNSDDFYEQNTLIRVANYWNKSQFDFLLGNVILCDEKGNEISKPKSYLKYEDIYYPCVSFVPQPASFFSASILRKVGGKLDESFQFAMDVDFWIKISGLGVKFIVVDEYFTQFRQHNQTKSSQGDLKFFAELIPKYMLNSSRKNTPYDKKMRHYLLKGYFKSLYHNDSKKYKKELLFFLTKNPLLVLKFYIKTLLTKF